MGDPFGEVGYLKDPEYTVGVVLCMVPIKVLRVKIQQMKHSRRKGVPFGYNGRTIVVARKLAVQLAERVLESKIDQAIEAFERN